MTKSKAQGLLEGIGRDNMQTLTLRYGNNDSRRAINTLLKTIEHLSHIGASRSLRHDVDGDGSYSIAVDGLDDNVDIPDTEDEPIHVRGVD
jgi:hypothetical protein